MEQMDFGNRISRLRQNKKYDTRADGGSDWCDTAGVEQMGAGAGRYGKNLLPQ